jgi:hypothetical protein
MLTLGDLKRLDLPDDTPILRVGHDSVWDYVGFQQADLVNAHSEADDGFYWLMPEDPAAMKDPSRIRQVILLTSH